MKQPSFFFSYRGVLLTNGTMLVLLGVLYGSGQLTSNFVLLLGFFMGAILFAFLELVLCLLALINGRRQLAFVYGALFLIVAKYDWWLLEQIQ